VNQNIERPYDEVMEQQERQRKAERIARLIAKLRREI